MYCLVNLWSNFQCCTRLGAWELTLPQLLITIGLMLVDCWSNDLTNCVWFLPVEIRYRHDILPWATFRRALINLPHYMWLLSSWPKRLIRGVTRRGKDSTIPGAPTHWEGPKSPKNVTNTFYNAAHLLLKDLRF